METEFELIAKTFQGLEEVLAKELTNLGANNIQIGRRMVSFTGDKAMMYRANLALRTAVRILKPIKHFKAHTADQVYDAVKSIDWKQYLTLQTTFAVDSVVYSQEFRHSKFVAYKVKDAIVDYFREEMGQRPNIRVTNPDIKLNIHIAEDSCTLSLDSSGESLHHRGYRQATVEAPINEVLAAGMILLTEWNGQCDLIDPMCGSGTIAIEAALIARNIMPGIFRKEFAFEKWQDFDRNLLDTVYNDDSQERDFNHTIYGYDLNQKAIEGALANAKAAGVLREVTFQQRPFQEFTRPEQPSVIITNPPYGERISTPDLLGLYRTIGERLKKEFCGNEAWILSYREECFDQIGLKPSIKIPLYNGALDCEFRKYVLFDGKLSEFREAGEDLKTDDERRRMAEKKRFKQHREFKDRIGEEEDNTEGIPAYILRKHRDFEENRLREERRIHRESREPRSERKPFRRDDRNDNGPRSAYRSDKPRNDRNRSFGRGENAPYEREQRSYGENRERRSFGRDGKPVQRDNKLANRDFKKKRYED